MLIAASLPSALTATVHVARRSLSTTSFAHAGVGRKLGGERARLGAGSGGGFSSPLGGARLRLRLGRSSAWVEPAGAASGRRHRQLWCGRLGGFACSGRVRRFWAVLALLGALVRSRRQNGRNPTWITPGTRCCTEKSRLCHYWSTVFTSLATIGGTGSEHGRSRLTTASGSARSRRCAGC